MRTSSVSATLSGMGNPLPLRVDLTLELEPEPDPPRGQLLTRGQSHRFDGWLGLAIALERAIDTERETHQQSQPSPQADG